MRRSFVPLLILLSAAVLACTSDTPDPTPGPASPSPGATEAPPWLSLRPIERPDALDGPLADVDPTEFGTYLYDWQTETLWQVPLQTQWWSPTQPVLATAGCCAGGGVLGVLDAASRKLIEFGPHEGQIRGWVPDGSGFLFQRRTSTGFGETGFVSADGLSAEHLPELDQASVMIWRPDSRQIAFDSDDGLRLYDFDTSGSRLILPAQGDDRALPMAWSPDGRWLAYRIGLSGLPDSSQGLLDLDSGTHVIPLTKCCSHAEWSPDGDYVYFLKDSAPGERELFLLPTSELSDPGAYRRVEGVAPLHPVWSPDSRRIVYTQYGCGSGDWSLHLLDAETGDVTELLGSRLRIGLAWSPDGSRLSYAAYDENERGIYVLDLGTGEERLLVQSPRELSPRSGDWSSDGRFLLFALSGGFGICN